MSTMTVTTPTYCPSCGEKWEPVDSLVCPKCGTPANRIERPMFRMNPWNLFRWFLAIVGAFIVGYGTMMILNMDRIIQTTIFEINAFEMNIVAFIGGCILGVFVLVEAIRFIRRK